MSIDFKLLDNNKLKSLKQQGNLLPTSNIKMAYTSEDIFYMKGINEIIIGMRNELETTEKMDKFLIKADGELKIKSLYSFTIPEKIIIKHYTKSIVKMGNDVSLIFDIYRNASDLERDIVYDNYVVMKHKRDNMINEYFKILKKMLSKKVIQLLPSYELNNAFLIGTGSTRFKSRMENDSTIDKQLTKFKMLGYVEMTDILAFENKNTIEMREKTINMLKNNIKSPENIRKLKIFGL